MYHEIKTIDNVIENRQEPREYYQQFVAPSWLDRHNVECLQESFSYWRDFILKKLRHTNEMEKRREIRASSNERMVESMRIRVKTKVFFNYMSGMSR